MAGEFLERRGRGRIEIRNTGERIGEEGFFGGGRGKEAAIVGEFDIGDGA